MNTNTQNPYIPRPAVDPIGAGSAEEFSNALGGQFTVNQGFAGGGSMVISEPSTVVGNQTGTPFATLAEANPNTGQAQPEQLAGAQVTPLVPNPVAPDGTTATPQPAQAAGQQAPNSPTNMGLLMAQLLGTGKLNPRRRSLGAALT